MARLRSRYALADAVLGYAGRPAAAEARLVPADAVAVSVAAVVAVLAARAVWKV